MLSITVEHTVAFNELDPMNVVWHGNYANYFELARAALLHKIGMGYAAMQEFGYAWPVVKLSCKYIRSARLGQRLAIRAEITEYHNTITLKFAIRDAESGELLTRGETMQMAVSVASGETCMVSPPCLLNCIENYLQQHRLQ